MRRTLPLVVFAAIWAAPALAWQTPGKGSADRTGMMDALRPLAAWNLGAPVEFVVNDLRVAGAAGFASVSPQRPGGQPIDLRATPMVQRDGADPAYMDGATMQALMQREGTTWVAVHWQIGATDAWWDQPRFCAAWAGVLPEIC
ncbi:hypothetical protein [Gemmobacter caeruleus]|uniref:hypothetical protein n=1 Tax=Gemmobacter caeruleus TaxID=2595004 RepID=UPI0011ECDEA1|nr:hypothetical protein [Gemmobacter caeruleus]